MLLADTNAHGSGLALRGESAHTTHRQNVRDEERIVSVVAGGLAVGAGLAARSWAGAAGALLGSGLLYRGVTGHCHLYQALGVSTTPHSLPEGAQEHPIGAVRAVTIQKPAREIYDTWKRADVLTRLFDHFADVREAEPGVLRWTLHDPLGRAHSWDTRVEDDTPGERLVLASAPDALIAYRNTLQISPAPGDRGSEVRLRLELVPHGAIARALGKLMPSALVAQRTLANLKSLLEAGELPILHPNPAAR